MKRLSLSIVSLIALLTACAAQQGPSLRLSGTGTTGNIPAFSSARVMTDSGVATADITNAVALAASAVQPNHTGDTTQIGDMTVTGDVTITGETSINGTTFSYTTSPGPYDDFEGLTGGLTLTSSEVPGVSGSYTRVADINGYPAWTNGTVTIKVLLTGGDMAFSQYTEPAYTIWFSGGQSLWGDENELNIENTAFYYDTVTPPPGIEESDPARYTTDIVGTYDDPILSDYVITATNATLLVADATAATHALNRQTADLRYGTTLGTATASTTNTTLDCSTATSWTVTLEANTTFTITGITSGYDAAIKLTLVQDATGSRTVTWPANTTWSYGLEPVLTTTTNAVDIIYLSTSDGGSNFVGIAAAYDVK